MTEFLLRSRSRKAASFGLRPGFTLIELLVVISIIALLIAVLLPALSAARTAARRLASNTQIRGIQQAFYTHAVDNGGLYAGVENPSGLTANDVFTNEKKIRTVGGSSFQGAFFGGRYAILLEGGYLTPEYLISPAETDERVQPWDSGVPDNFYKNNATFWSYALPILRNTAAGIPTWEGRVKAWSIDSGSSVVVASDRLKNSVNPNSTPLANLESLWSTPGSGWVGGVSFGDNHVVNVDSAEIEGTDYGTTVSAPDNIFSQEAATDPGVAAGAPRDQTARQGVFESTTAYIFP